MDAARAFLDPQSYTPAPPSDLPDLSKAADLLEEAIQESQTIGVWGDFDVDGQTATALLVSALEDLGAQVVFHIPVRAEESHGVNIPNLKKLIAQDVDLLLTCDTGIAAHEEVAYAKERGLTVIITDHHDLPPTLPDADAVVNPKRLPPGHPLSDLPGVGAAYKLVEELYDRAGRAEASDSFLDLVALGIVADVATQTGDTRYLLQRGLEVLRHTERLGLQVLIENAKLDPIHLTEENIGFGLGPRLNALGRLGDANTAVEFLTTGDLSRARVLAAELEGLNAHRRLLTDQVFEGAQAQIEKDPALLDNAALVLAHPDWPGGVIGIVASRLVERYHKPAILLTAPEGELARGSARSIQGCNITAAIAAHQEMVENFGGHPMAAGLAIQPERIPTFRRALSRTVEAMVSAEALEATLQVDGYLGLEEISLALVEDLARLAPFGAGNPRLTLASRGLTLKSHSKLGRGGRHLQLIVEDEDDNTLRVIWWRGAGNPLPQGRFDMAYTVQTTTYRGEPEVQAVWVDVRPLDEPPVEVQPDPIPLEVIDHRQEAHPAAILESLRAEGEIQVWCEGEDKKRLAGQDRDELEPSGALAIWTIPPGRGELMAVLEKVSPERVYLFGVDPEMDRQETFIRRLAGLVKHTLSAKAGKTSIPELAAATAQRVTTVRFGLAWLETRGDITLQEHGEDEILLGKGDGTEMIALPLLAAQLKAILDETAAYRAHFKRAEGVVDSSQLSVGSGQ